MRAMTARLPLALAALCLAGASLGANDLPKPAGAVNDFADVLSDAQERALTDLVQGVEDATTSEIAVATVTTLDGMTVEEYANRLFADWGIGRAGQDNGVLILVAPNEREMRIEVGYGVEEILPDGLAGQIVQETFLPRFRSGDYGAGIVEGTNRVAAIVRRNQPLTAEQRAALRNSRRLARAPTSRSSGCSCRSSVCSSPSDSAWAAPVPGPGRWARSSSGSSSVGVRGSSRFCSCRERARRSSPASQSWRRSSAS